MSDRPPFELTDHQLAALREDGFVVTGFTLERALVDRGRIAVERAWQAQLTAARASGSREQRNLPWMQVRPEIQRVHRADAALAEICRHPALAGLARSVCGPDADVLWNQAHLKAPGTDAFGVIPLHQDTVYAQLDAPSFNVWIALTDVGPEDGPLQLVPGSHDVRDRPHTWDDELKFFVCEAPDGRATVPLRRGEAVIFDTACVHGSAPNRGEDLRIGYSVTVIPSHARLRSTGEAFGDQYPILRDGVPVDELLRALATELSSPTQALEADQAGGALLRELLDRMPENRSRIEATWSDVFEAVRAGDPDTTDRITTLLGIHSEEVMINGDLIRSRTDPDAIVREYRGIRADYDRDVLERLLRRALDLDPAHPDARRELEALLGG